MSEPSFNIHNAVDVTKPLSPDSIRGGSVAVGRSGLLDQFGLELPTGDMIKDVQANRKVLLQRGVTIKQVKAEPDMGPGVVQFIACTEGVKRDGNIVRNDGWHFENFARNPQFLWCHDYGSLPIGRHVDWKVEKVGGESVLRLWSQFCDEGLYPFADTVRRMYEKGYLNAGSVGWIPIEYEPIFDEENEHVVGLDFKENDLLEFSGCPVPSDPNALIEAVQRGVIKPEEVDKMVIHRSDKADDGYCYVLSSQDQVKSVEGAVVELPEESAEVELDVVLDEMLEDLGETVDEDDGAVGTTAKIKDLNKILEDLEMVIVDPDLKDNEDVFSAEEVVKDEVAEVACAEESEEGLAEEEDVLPEEIKFDPENKLADIIVAKVAVMVEKLIAEALSSPSVENEEAPEVVSEDNIDVGVAAGEAQAAAYDGEKDKEAALEVEAESRIGAKFSRSHKDRLRTCRDMIGKAFDEMENIIDEDEERVLSNGAEDPVLDDSDKPKDEIQTQAVDAVDWGKAVAVATRIQAALSVPPSEVDSAAEEAEAKEDPSVDDIKTKLATIRASLMGDKKEADEDLTDIKSDYMSEILGRIAKLKDSV